MIEIITIGNELLSGNTVDTNASFLADTISALGLTVSRITTVGDSQDDIIHALRNVRDTSRFVIITGGLGPTDDDITSKSAAKALGRKLQMNNTALSAIKKKLKETGRTLSITVKKQAFIPEGAVVIPNPIGTACGFLLEHGKIHYIFLPGVPNEVREITGQFLTAYLKEKSASRQAVITRTLRVFGIWESAICERLQGALPESKQVSIAYLPHFPEVHLRITARGEDADRLESEIAHFEQIISEKIGEFIYAVNDKSMEAVVGRLLRERNATLSVAESCTGGLIAHRLTNIPGSSDYLERSVVVYSNRSKRELLQVPVTILEQYGAVSSQTAHCMAEGIRNLSGTTFGLSITGIAGPSGGSKQKPVGTVFIGVASSETTRVSVHHFHGNREQIKVITAQTALNQLRMFMLYPERVG